jgi:hypothetical protein
LDKRKAWREQEQALVLRWNAAVARHQEATAAVSLAGVGADVELVRSAESARVEMEAVRRKVAKLKVEFNSGKRY